MVKVFEGERLLPGIHSQFVIEDVGYGIQTRLGGASRRAHYYAVAQVGEQIVVHRFSVGTKLPRGRYASFNYQLEGQVVAVRLRRWEA